MDYPYNTKLYHTCNQPIQIEAFAQEVVPVGREALGVETNVR